MPVRASVWRLGSSGFSLGLFHRSSALALRRKLLKTSVGSIFLCLPCTAMGPCECRASPPTILRNIPLKSVNSVSGGDCSLHAAGIILGVRNTAILSISAVPRAVWREPVPRNSGHRQIPNGEQLVGCGRRGANLADVALLGKHKPCSAPGSGPSRRARVAVLLNAGYAQTGKTVALERPLPGEELLLGELIATQGLLHRDLAATNGSDHSCFATDYPSLGVRRWQIGHWRYSHQRLRDVAIHRAPPGL